MSPDVTEFEHDLATYALTSEEADAIASLVGRLRKEFSDPSASPFFDAAWSFLPNVPSGLRHFLADFRLTEFSSACLLTGLPVDEESLDPTPLDIRQARQNDAGLHEEYLIALVAASLGEVFNWSTLQAGRLIQDVIPIRGEEIAQSGHGSTAPLAWHTEDAFHESRADYLLLLGLRNPDAVPTTVASIRAAELPPKHVATLREPRFRIIPDDEHIAQLTRAAPDHPSLERMRQLRDAPPRVPVLFGDPSTPYLRIDPVFMRVAGEDREAQNALDVLQGALEVALTTIVLSPGDILIVDNYLAVHGRRAFKARHDGTDRWLKKVLVARDLRKSRNLRATAASRVLT